MAKKDNLSTVGLAPTREDPCEIIADKAYHSRKVLKTLDGGAWKSRISEPAPAKGYLRWPGDEAVREAVYANRRRPKSGVGRAAMRKRGELVEAASPMCWIAAACAGLGFGAARTSPSVT